MNNLYRKRRELGRDYSRIQSLDIESRFSEFFKVDSISDYCVYGGLLFDIWTETKSEKSLYETWKSFCSNKDTKTLVEFFCLPEDIKLADTDIYYPLLKEVKADRWKNEKYSYYLGTLIWKK